MIANYYYFYELFSLGYYYRYLLCSWDGSTTAKSSWRVSREMRAMEGSYVLGCVQPCKPQKYSRCPQDYRDTITIN
jgi:hypothetical protein